ncbi:hypothetical protein GDO78_018001 [Eleutherodactylus coqui]|uniref:Uncharacterized protein n=1 Tax=Eleutherodactylus coqui TaxID=57060 RepID=A0A8J6AZP1_ELECQ|nr:hypothetical protein GDO78_018001 [Eleutherodactylus coqui]
MLSLSFFILGSPGQTGQGQSSDDASVGVQCRGGTCRGAPAGWRGDILSLGTHRHFLCPVIFSGAALLHSGGCGGCWGGGLCWDLHQKSSFSAFAGSPPPGAGHSAFHCRPPRLSVCPRTRDWTRLLPRRWHLVPRKIGVVDCS